MSPFFLKYRRHLQVEPTLNLDTMSTDLNNIIKVWLNIQKQMKAALTLAAECIKWYYDKDVQLIPFKVGNLVLLKMKNYQKTEAGLRLRYNRPFKILKWVSEVDFKLDLSAWYCAYHSIFYTSKLMVYTMPLVSG